MPQKTFEDTALRACRSDACNSGRGKCPTPDACRLPEGECRALRRRAWRLFFGAFVASAIGCAVLITTTGAHP